MQRLLACLLSCGHFLSKSGSGHPLRQLFSLSSARQERCLQARHTRDPTPPLFPLTSKSRARLQDTWLTFCCNGKCTRLSDWVRVGLSNRGGSKTFQKPQCRIASISI